MKITESQLRKIIKQQLNEMSDPTIRAANAGYALVVVGDDRIDQVIIYDPKVFIDAINGDEITHHDLLSVFEASVQASVDSRVDDFSNNMSKVIAATVSKEGSKMGPAAYDCAMWIAQDEEYNQVPKTPEGFAERPPGGLTPDRGSVSSSAKSVWQKYNSRSDIEKFKLDDISEPETKQKWDDSHIHKNDPTLNYTYNIKKEPAGYKQLRKNHRDFLVFLRSPDLKANRNARLIDKNFSDRINLASAEVFYKRYNEPSMDLD
jgi:hypothetical protein